MRFEGRGLAVGRWSWYIEAFAPRLEKGSDMETSELKTAIAELEARVQHIREWL